MEITQQLEKKKLFEREKTIYLSHIFGIIPKNVKKKGYKLLWLMLQN